MTNERIRYWYNRDTGVIHKSSCANCLMTYNGREKADWAGIRANWWGPYESLGAVMDVAISTRSPFSLCGMGCGSWPRFFTTSASRS